MKTKRLQNCITWITLGLALALGPPVHAQWQGSFTGQVTNIFDPDNFFQGLVQNGTPVSGSITYDPGKASDPNTNGTLYFSLGNVTVTNYYPLQFTVINDNWDGSDSISFQTYTRHPPEFKQDATRYIDGGVAYNLLDPSGTALSSSEFLELPLGHAWLGLFSTTDGQF